MGLGRQLKKALHRVKTRIMNRIVNLFKKTHDEDNPPYPQQLERHYRVSKKVLGVGSFAVVKECTDRATGQPYALKIILKKAIAGKEHMLSTELDVLKKVRHRNIVSMHDLFESKDAVYIVADLASGGELFQQLLDKGSYTEKDASNLVKQILDGVAYLHERDIVHRDLKPENLLFKDKTETADLMITDFGLSKILDNHNQVLLTACGTPGYVAPEVLLQTGHGRPVDMWSIGVIAYTLLCGYTPFWGEDQAALFEAIMAGKYEFDDEYWSEISSSAKDLISKLLKFEPELRITAAQALQHPWITGAGAPPQPGVDLLRRVRANFSGRQTFRKAVTALAVVNRIRRDGAAKGHRRNKSGGESASDPEKDVDGRESFDVINGRIEVTRNAVSEPSTYTNLVVKKGGVGEDKAQLGDLLTVPR